MLVTHAVLACSARAALPLDRLWSSTMAKRLIEGIDYTLDDQGRRVFTAAYLLNLGYCCGLDCRNCPYHPKTLENQEESDAA